MRIVILVGLVALLSACGSKRRTPVPVAVTPAASYMPTANGPIKSACLAADRKKASNQLCGCVQYVADKTLSSREQRKAVAFFADPHLAQVERQEGSMVFWKTYKAFAKSAERTCRG